MEIETTLRPRLPVDLDLTIGAVSWGPGDPTVRADADGSWWRATRTPLGPATTRFSRINEDEIRVQAWGEGAAWAIEAAPDLLGARDSLDGFAPTGKLLTIHKRFEGMRVPRSRAVFEAAVGSVLGQLVTFREAHVQFIRITRAWSDPAPGPREMMLPVAPSALTRRASYELRALGVEQKRGTTLVTVARRAARIEEAIDMTPAAALARLEALPGIGPWTSATIARVALGDADAVPVGDFHLPNTIAYAFTGAARGDDAQMLELLAPYAGHRGRVVALIQHAGIAAPRFGPRRPIRHRAR